MKYLMVLTLVISLLSSCANNKLDSCTTTCSTLSTLKYSNFSNFIATSCATGSGCHGTGSSSGDFSSYTGLQPYLANGKFKQRVIIEKNMPPSGGVRQSYLDSLSCWICNGYPQ
jgi:hypothetical protein